MKRPNEIESLRATPGQAYEMGGRLADILFKDPAADRLLVAQNRFVGPLWTEIEAVMQKHLTIAGRWERLDKNPIISVDRTREIALPGLEGYASLIHPELQGVGLSEIDVRHLRPHQLGYECKLDEALGFYRILEKAPDFEDELGWHELMSIWARGVDFYRFILEFKILIGWKSAVKCSRQNEDRIEIPCLIESPHAGDLQIHWLPIRYEVSKVHPERRLSWTTTTKDSKRS